MLLFHCLPQSALGRLLLSSPMDRQQHQYLRIQIRVVVDTATPPWCHLGTLPLDFLPLDEHVADWQALKLSNVSCQISDQFRSRTHPIPSSGSSPLCQFSNWPGRSLPSASL